MQVFAKRYLPHQRNMFAKIFDEVHTPNEN